GQRKPLTQGRAGHVKQVQPSARRHHHPSMASSDINMPDTHTAHRMTYARLLGNVNDKDEV
ncbi:hypothetical protein, partial [Enterobacter cancerogenus]|uniref:hypothetical protein n=1 Tax=Enterobacter cancerogenus TaxID=69218 RepID=UPI001E2F11AA